MADHSQFAESVAACPTCGSTVPALRNEVLGPCRDRWHLRPDEPPKTVGTPYHHEDERECYYRADGSGWWPYRFEDGVLNGSAGTVCFRLHPDPTTVSPPEMQVDK